jgi:hypothetical protein
MVQSIAATLLRDPDALAALLDNDGVLLEPGHSPVVGKEEFTEFIKQNLAKSASTNEWGFFDSTVRTSEHDQPRDFRARFLRVLKQKDYLRPAGEKIGLQGVGWHTFRHTYRTLIDDVGTPLGVQQRLMRHADIKTTMNTYGSAFEKSKRRANSRVAAALVLPPAIKRQLKDRAREVSLKNLRPETAAIQ